jgi:aminopeptidase N
MPAYFDTIGRFWAKHDSQNAQAFIVYGYPTVYVDQSVVDATDAWLADESQPGPLRRLVKDGRDGQVRALAARHRDAAAGSGNQEGKHRSDGEDAASASGAVDI